MINRFCFAFLALVLLFLFTVSIALANVLVDTAWVRRYNGPGNSLDDAYDIAVDGSGNVYVTGRSPGSGTGFDYATIKYDSNGSKLWVKRYNGPGNEFDYANAIAVDGSGNVYVTGWSDGSGTSSDYATIKFDPNGNELWVKRYNGPGNWMDIAYAIAVDGSGNVYVTGWSDGDGTDDDYATIKYDPNGNELWVKRYDGPGYWVDEAWAIAVDGSGNVYVTGKSYGTYYDYATIKYDTNGDELWVKRYNGPGNEDDWAYAIVVDGSGNVYVTGYSESNAVFMDKDYATIKYDSNGNELWVKRYNGPGNDQDWAYAIAVDSSGNVYVTGYSGGSEIYWDYATIKYDTNGNELWVKRYNGPGNEYDWAYAIVVDNSGNVYVTGWSAGNGTYDDYATIKYDPNGNELWVKRYNGPVSSNDGANAIAVDGSGNVYVTGYIECGAAHSDYATIKYYQCLCGDANLDGVIDIGDIVYLIGYVFYSGPQPQPNSRCNDANFDGVIDIGDIVFLISYVFYGGTEPSCQ
jgi:uncharacterized delta-60 repeat protein